MRGIGPDELPARPADRVGEVMGKSGPARGKAIPGVERNAGRLPDLLIESLREQLNDRPAIGAVALARLRH